MYMAIGQCGSVLGSHLYPKTEGPRYVYVGFILVFSVLNVFPLAMDSR